MGSIADRVVATLEAAGYCDLEFSAWERNTGDVVVYAAAPFAFRHEGERARQLVLLALALASTFCVTPHVNEQSAVAYLQVEAAPDA